MAKIPPYALAPCNKRSLALPSLPRSPRPSTGYNRLEPMADFDRGRTIVNTGAGKGPRLPGDGSARHGQGQGMRGLMLDLLNCS